MAEEIAKLSADILATSWEDMDREECRVRLLADAKKLAALCSSDTAVIRQAEERGAAMYRELVMGLVDLANERRRRHATERPPAQENLG